MSDRGDWRFKITISVTRPSAAVNFDALDWDGLARLGSALGTVEGVHVGVDHYGNGAENGPYVTSALRWPIEPDDTSTSASSKE